MYDIYKVNLKKCDRKFIKLESPQKSHLEKKKKKSQRNEITYTHTHARARTQDSHKNALLLEGP